jgi:hypothetical protein
MAEQDDKNRCFGKREGLEKRLAMWARQLGMDKRYPWVGLGLIDDIKAACRELGGDPDKWYDDVRPQPKKATAPAPEPKAMEYDL